MMHNPPLINFNGALQVDSLVVGSIQIQTKRVPALKILLQQTLEYPVLAYGPPFAEVYAYCLEARQVAKTQLEVYAPCYLVQDDQSGTAIPVISNLTWYISAALRQKCEQQIEAILGGDYPGDESYPEFEGKPFAKFSAEGRS